MHAAHLPRLLPVPKAASAARSWMRDLAAVAVRGLGGAVTKAATHLPLSPETLANSLHGRYSASATTLRVIAEAWLNSVAPPPWSKWGHYTAFCYLMPRLGSEDWDSDVALLRFVMELESRPVSPFSGSAPWDTLLIQYFISLGDLIHNPPPGIAHHPAGSPEAAVYLSVCRALKKSLKKQDPDRRRPPWKVLFAKLVSDPFFVESWNRPAGQKPPRARTPELLAEFEQNVEPALRAYMDLVPTSSTAPKNLLAVASHYNQEDKFAQLLVALGRALSPGRSNIRPGDVDLSDRDSYDEDFDNARAWQDRPRSPRGGRLCATVAPFLCAAFLATAAGVSGTANPPSFNGDLLLSRMASPPPPSFNGDLLLH